MPKQFWVHRKFFKLNFNQYSNDLFLTEFFSICIRDSYRIRSLRHKHVNTILDIGANQGLFVLIARKVYPEANIHAYEPNRKLYEFIKPNCEQLNVRFYPEAVMSANCKVKLTAPDSDLATQAYPDQEGEVEGISFHNTIERLGSRVDLVKMDCEGGEWELLECIDDWKHIRFLTMEYHLWHGNGHSLEELKQKMERIRFRIIALRPINQYCGLLFAQNAALSQN